MSALASALCAAAILFLTPVAFAKSYTDVSKKCWARVEIAWVTDQGPAGAKALDDFPGHVFKPGQAATREQLARALVVLGGLQNEQVTPVALPDVKPNDPDEPYIQIALHLRLLTLYKDGFRPTATLSEWQVDAVVLRLLQVLNPSADWTMLTTLRPAAWQPNPGWKTGAPGFLAIEIAARDLGLRYNHPAISDALEVSPRQTMDRAEVATILYRARHLSAWSIADLRKYDKVVLPQLTARQKQIVAFALKYIGFPYVWGGEYPSRNSPYGRQAHGGFDCSGFDWWVMKMHFDYTINERTAAGMAGAAKHRVTRAKLVPGDLIFFGPKGPKSTPASIYHAALYLGNGWFIQSTGSLDGVGLSSLNTDTYWKAAFAWGRRVLTKGQFTPPVSPAPAS